MAVCDFVVWCMCVSCIKQKKKKKKEFALTVIQIYLEKDFWLNFWQYWNYNIVFMSFFIGCIDLG